MPESKRYDLTRGAPKPETFPIEFSNGYIVGANLADLINRDPDLLGYRGPDFMGYGPLRELLAKKHGVEPDQIILGHGGMDVMSYWLTFLNKQLADGVVDSTHLQVGVEAPTYDRMLINLHNNNMRAFGVPIRADGPDMDKLRDLLTRGIKAFYGIPVGQNPTAYNYTLAQRTEVEELCASYGAYVLWDLAYQNLTYGWEEEPFTDPADNVFAQLNFTKEISPGLKCGYLVVPKKHVVAMKEVVSSARLNAVHPVHALYHRFLETRRYPEHLEHLRNIFGARMAELTAAIAQHAPDAQTVPVINSGYFAQLHFPGIEDHDDFMRRFSERGIIIGDARASYTREDAHRGVGELRLPGALLEPGQPFEILATAAEVYREIISI